MSIKIKKANWRTKPIYTIKKTKKMGNLIYYERGNKGLRDREWLKYNLLKKH